MPVPTSRTLVIAAAALLPQWLAGQQFLDERIDLTANQPPADLTGDGLPDLLHLDSGNVLRWRRNLGNLRFDASQVLATLPNSPVPDVVLPGDFDGDGDVDVLSFAEGVVAPSMRLDLVQQVSPGVFATIPITTLTITVASYPSAVVRTDFDGDGDLDLVLATGEPAGLCMYALRNDGALLYTDVTASRFAGVVIGSVSRLRTGDVDSDGRQDLFVDAPGLRILRNTGASYVDQTSTRLPNQSVLTSVLGDLDGDGDPDAVTNVTFQGVQVWTNQAGIYIDSTATSLPAPVPGGSPGNLFDSDGDGDLDLFLRQEGIGQTSPTRQQGLVLSNDGTGRLLQAIAVTPFVVASTASPGVTADMEGDGDADIVLLGSPTKVLLNHGVGILLGAEKDAVDGPAADMNGDGVPDFLTSAGVLLQRPLAAPTLRPWIGGTPTNLGPGRIGDVDGDGDLDLIAVGLWRNDGTGNLTLDPTSGLTNVGSFSVLADFDGDADRDVLAAVSGGIQLFVNNGLGQFVGALPLPTQGLVLDVAAGDIDGDGDVDAAVPGFLTAPTRLLLNQGNGTFTVLPAPAAGTIGARVQILDLRSTGQTDLFTLVSGNWLAYRLQAGALVDVTSTVVPPGLAGQRLAVGDVDRDGDVDIVGRDLLRNDGTGNYAIEVMGLSGTLQLLDVDGDQDLDLITGSQVRKNRERDLTAPLEAHVGRPLRLDVVAAPGRAQGEIAVLAASLQQAQPALPTPFGLLHLNTVDAYWLLALTNVTGLAEVDLPVPNAAALVGLALHFQALHFGATGVGLGNGIRTIIE